MRQTGTIAVAAAGLFLVLAPAEALANRESQALCAKAAEQLYNIDHDQALATYRQAVAADPQDATAYRGLASALWVTITFLRGNMTVDDYLGRVTRSGTMTGGQPPPRDMAAAFRDALDRSLALSRTRLAANPKDTDAHYEVGAAVGLRASYVATVEGSALGAFRAAREAYDEHETVLALNPKRKDAALIVGTYRYVVASLALPLRWVAYVAGFGGDKERGVGFVEEAATYPGDSRTDAQFALVLIYNREKRYDEALKELAILRERFPRNRLILLESGSTSLRAGRAAQAERFFDDGISRFADDTRTRMFGENALWHYKRGAARAVLGRVAEAEQDLKKAVSLEGRKWVHGRTHLELGKLALKNGNRALSKTELQAAIPLCDADNDGAAADEARRLLR